MTKEEYLKRIRTIVNIFLSFKYRLNKNRSEVPGY
jgi:hypothetical protein